MKITLLNRVYQKQPLYPKCRVRFEYILPFPNPTYEITRHMSLSLSLYKLENYTKYVVIIVYNLKIILLSRAFIRNNLPTHYSPQTSLMKSH